MITYDDVIASHPEAKNFNQAQVEQLCNLANLGFPDARFGGKVAAADAGRVNYVMHMLMKPSVNLNSPHIAARMARPGRSFIKTPHVWDGTHFGQQLKAAVKS